MNTMNLNIIKVGIRNNGVQSVQQKQLVVCSQRVPDEFICTQHDLNVGEAN